MKKYITILALVTGILLCIAVLKDYFSSGEIGANITSEYALQRPEIPISLLDEGANTQVKQGETEQCRTAVEDLNFSEIEIQRKQTQIKDLLRNFMSGHDKEPFFYLLLAKSLGIESHWMYSVANSIGQPSKDQFDPIGSLLLEDLLIAGDIDGIVQAVNNDKIDPSKHFLVSSIETTLISILLDNFKGSKLSSHLVELGRSGALISIYDLAELSKRNLPTASLEELYNASSVEVSRRFMTTYGSDSLASLALRSNNIELFKFWYQQGSPVIGDLFNKREMLWFAKNDKDLNAEDRESIFDALADSKLLQSEKLSLLSIDSSVHNNYDISAYRTLGGYLSLADKNQISRLVNDIFNIALRGIPDYKSRAGNKCYLETGEAVTNYIMSFQFSDSKSNPANYALLNSSEESNSDEIIVNNNDDLMAVFTGDDTFATKTAIDKYYLRELELLSERNGPRKTATQEQEDALALALELIEEQKWKDAEAVLVRAFDDDFSYNLLLDRAIDVENFPLSEALNYIGKIDVHHGIMTTLLGDSYRAVLRALLEADVAPEELGFNQLEYYNHFSYIIDFGDADLLYLLLEHNARLKQNAPGYDALDFALMALIRDITKQPLEKIDILFKYNIEVKTSHLELVRQIALTNNEQYQQLVQKHPSLRH